MAYTCACNVVRDQDVLAAIDAGARTLDQISHRTGAGADCGGCLPTIEALLALAENPTPMRSSES